MSPLFKSALVLGLLSAVGPFAIDMFLPALPTIAADLRASVGTTQGTISFYFMAFGLSQLIYGPLADQAGRKVPIYIGLTLFIAGSVAATLAPTIAALITARMIQGAGAASLMVVTRAIIRDQYRGYEATRLMSLVMLVFSVSPMFAPLAGSGLILLTGWRGVFAAMAVAGIVAFVITALLQPETLPKDKRVKVSLSAMARGARTLFRDPVFLGLTFIGAFSMSAFFVFIASASFVYTQSFGLTPAQFSLAFTVNAMGFIGASQIAPGLMRKHGALKIISLGVFGYAASMLALFALVLAGFGTFWVMVAGLVATFAFVGLVIPTAMVASLDDHGEIAGLASSLGGTLQMVAGGIMTAAAGPFFDGTPLPMVAAMMTCSLIALILLLVVTPRARMRMTPF
ncbi:MAG: multidrug effflux MFS transporter [Alphaproteobacteria bacterium]|nr:multidrug effflux MFS transporter [Alphaproteobacteria bacterium]MBU1279340.1 multidrug effflux MFS transporter [Alphaproteobacteria bacterium]MBU1574165.1 multidrug effflux MFS transporter [Alphaproteobacteria bacterium]MBU1827447.1 multidrug effflux MFS transporter [Alphaproteobacteria bacterium]MBU2078403.1 multidrug effflux MFS transporter [Alphaproteobacteria bacterium]